MHSSGSIGPLPLHPEKSVKLLNSVLLKAEVFYCELGMYLVVLNSWQLGKSLCLYWTPIGYLGLHQDSFGVAFLWDILPSSSRLHSSNGYHTYGMDLDRFHQHHCAQLRKLLLRNFLASAYHYNLNLNHNKCDDFIFCKFKDSISDKIGSRHLS